MKKPGDLQQLILHISTDFINLVPGEVDNKISEALKLIEEFTGSDRSYVFLLNRSLNTLTNTHEWCAAGMLGYSYDELIIADYRKVYKKKGIDYG
ncbi:MAG: hypothetical protein H8D42_02070 [Candidatus Marinimicrobia bacterium]|nr:hypothetical protein [Candidatus Neomarinimicrobiota bacterium]MBL7067090.1 hypothetical protein [Candidatus Neomarinimicrobiota bacterium]